MILVNCQELLDDGVNTYKARGVSLFGGVLHVSHRSRERQELFPPCSRAR